MTDTDVCHLAFGGLGGQAIVVRGLAEQFAARGLTNAIVLHAPAAEIVADADRWPHLDPIVAVPRTGKIDLAAMVAVARAVRRLRPRVVLCHSHESVAAAFAGQLLARRRPQVVLVEHQSMALRGRSENLRSLLALPFCRAVVVFTEEYARRYPFRRLPLPAVRRTTVIANGIDTDRYHPGPTEAREPFTVGRGCRLIPIKDVDVLIDAVKALSDAPPTTPVRLRIAGDGPSRPALEEQVGRLGLGEQVELAGALDEPAMLEFYASLDAYALATKGESISVALLEAYACGLAVVASDVDGVGSFVRDEEDGLLVPPGDPVAFAEALRRLVDEPGLARRLGDAARRRAVAEHSSTTMADGYVALLHRLDAI